MTSSKLPIARRLTNAVIEPARAFRTNFSGHCWLAAVSASSEASTSLVRQRHARLVVNTTLMLLFALLHVADGLVTYLGLTFTSVGEVNPVLNSVADIFGLGVSIFVLKLMCITVIAWIYRDRHKINSCWSTTTLMGAVGFYCWVVSNNIILVAAA